MKLNLLRLSNKHMVSAIVIIAKRQPQYTYIVKVEDWLNPRRYVIDAQDPYTGDSAVIEKLKYKIGWVIVGYACPTGSSRFPWTAPTAFITSGLLGRLIEKYG